MVEKISCQRNRNTICRRGNSRGKLKKPDKAAGKTVVRFQKPLRPAALSLHLPFAICQLFGLVFGVFCPFARVVQNVLADGVQFSVLADDMLVIVILLDRSGLAAGGVDLPGGLGFKVLDDGRQGNTPFALLKKENGVEMVGHDSPLI